MFEDVVQFTDFLVGRLEAYGMAGDKRDRAGLVAYCAGMFPTVREMASNSARRDAPSLFFESASALKQLECSEWETGGVGDEADRVAGSVGGIASRDFRCATGGGCGDVGVVEVKETVVDQCGTVVDGVDSGVRGKNYVRNKRKRAGRRARLEQRGLSSGTADGERVEKSNVTGGSVPWRSARVRKAKAEIAGVAGHFSDLPVDDQRALKESYAMRLRAENELKMFRAKQQLELEKAKDLTQLKKRQETHIMRQTEVNKVQVEKAFASLARTGNVPGVVGTVETVVTDGSSSASPVFSGVGSGTISPNSSISLAEIRAIQKDSLDKAQEIEKLKRRLNRLLDAMPYLKGQAFADPEAPETVNSGVTVDSNGFPIGEFGDGYDGGIREDGKWHFGQDIY